MYSPCAKTSHENGSINSCGPKFCGTDTVPGCPVCSLETETTPACWPGRFVVSPAGNLVPTRLGGRSSLKICRPYLSALAVRSMRRIRRKVDAGQRRKRVARASGLELWQANFAGECRAKGLSSGPPVGSALTERRSRWPRPARRTPCGQPNRPTRSTPSRLCHRSPRAALAGHLRLPIWRGDRRRACRRRPRDCETSPNDGEERHYSSGLCSQI